MSEAYLVGILFVATFFLHKESRIAAYIFAGLALVFWIPLGLIPYEYSTLYFLSAAIIDLTAIKILSKLNHLTKVISRIQLICMAFIFLDLFGWLGYMMEYSSSGIYNFVCSVLYALVILIILTGKHDHVSGTGMDRRHNGLYIFNSKSLHPIQTNKETARNR